MRSGSPGHTTCALEMRSFGIRTHAPRVATCSRVAAPAVRAACGCEASHVETSSKVELTRVAPVVARTLTASRESQTGRPRRRGTSPTVTYSGKGVVGRASHQNATPAKREVPAWQAVLFPFAQRRWERTPHSRQEQMGQGRSVPNVDAI